MILDAGALIGVDRAAKAIVTRLKSARRRGHAFRTNPMVVAQVWRDPRGRQAELAAFLHSVDVQAVTPAIGRAAGLLLHATGTADPVDASVVLLARPGDQILTSDVEDITRLARAAGLAVHVVAC